MAYAKYLQSTLVVVIAYILAHGLTAFLVTPLQSRFFPEITAFASLLYLPHGVRVLAAWLLGRFAFLPLFLGAFLSEVIFTPAEVSSAVSSVILMSIAVGASSALLAFEIMKFLGANLYACRKLRVHWSRLFIVGVMASMINSVGQSLVFFGAILPGHSLTVLVTYAVGDLTGLVVTTITLMLIFRWMRLSAG